MPARFFFFLTLLLCLSACSGGSASSGNTSQLASSTGTAPLAGAASTSSTSTAPTSATAGTATGTSATGNSASDDTTTAARLTALTQKMGKPARFLLGAGSVDADVLQRLGIRPDIYDQYLNGVGKDSWISWNNPSGAYVQVVAQQAETFSAVPMFTVYQMAANGDGNLSGLTERSFMLAYWENLRILFNQIRQTGKPALVHFEPDFWGYAQRQASQNDPASVRVLVSIAPECANLPDHVGGFSQCLLRLGRTLAPHALLGFPPSLFGDLRGSEIAFLQRLGWQNADFLTMQTLDRDAGCFEARPQPEYCSRAGSGWYWDALNQSTPTFSEHFALAKRYHQALSLPLIWWQTPLGAPSSSSGGAEHWRDNRVAYFLGHPQELIAAGGVAAVFSRGEVHQTGFETDGGQFRLWQDRYLARPAALP